MMVDENYGLHHIEFHTINPDHLLDLFVRTYGFQLIAQRTTLRYSQWFLKSYECQILISSILNSDLTDEINFNIKHYDILSTLIKNETTHDFIAHRDTAFNIAIHVNSIQSILDKISDVEVLVSHRQAVDEYGPIDYACIKSCVGNVIHTLIDSSKYSGQLLPGFIPVPISERHSSTQMIAHRIDHIAFAVSKNTAMTSVAWYERVFGMARLFVHQEDDPFQGFSVRSGSIGMRLFASEYWKCAETGCMNKKTSTMKLVFAESLIENNSILNDQITTFIAQHKNQSGIQHVALECVDSIKNAVRISKENGAQFLSPLVNYYLKENNGHVIEEVGEDVTELAALGILLDNEADALHKSAPNTKILLQIFTKSIFNNDTFFFELIERRGATGFGAGNIRALWKAVQHHMSGVL